MRYFLQSVFINVWKERCMVKQPHTQIHKMRGVNFFILNPAAAHEKALEGWREMVSEFAQKKMALLFQVTSSTWVLEELLLYFLHFPFWKNKDISLLLCCLLSLQASFVISVTIYTINKIVLAKTYIAFILLFKTCHLLTELKECFDVSSFWCEWCELKEWFSESCTPCYVSKARDELKKSTELTRKQTDKLIS